MIQHILANVIAAATDASGGLHIITTLVKNWRTCTITEIFGIWYLQFDYGLHRKEMTYSKQVNREEFNKSNFYKVRESIEKETNKDGVLAQG